MSFSSRITTALADSNLQVALDGNFERSRTQRMNAMAALPNADLVRDRARAIRIEALSRLDTYLLQLEAAVQARGGVVHWAATAADANRIVLEIVQRKGDVTSPLVAKSKSMVSEEIGLNAALEKAGLRVVETDLGEYIVQLRGERPSHIVATAIHLRRSDVATLFEKHLGLPRTDDIPTLTAAARKALREVFVKADIGISGVNFGVAESGTLCLVTNEGNGRLCTTLPKVHIALMGIERVVPTLADLEIMLRVLARSATGQKITGYTNLLTGPRRRRDEPDGPDELHLILVDNGRSRVLGSELAESLLCIRCGACLNICPVYREIGGHAYDAVYPGPIGAVVAPALGGFTEFGELAGASSLCGACQEVCPVRIDIPTMLLKVRSAHVEETGGDAAWLGPAMKLWSFAMRSLPGYRLSLWLGRLGTRLLARNGWVRRLPGPPGGWTQSRDFPALARKSFRARFVERQTTDDRRQTMDDKRKT
ncbi:MAG: iron-sulfur cluster-binding protein [Chloroflexi bacterium]|nr:iron-sulfur cluster-binding protein [Chloroflexota bacterium]